VTRALVAVAVAATAAAFAGPARADGGDQHFGLEVGGAQLFIDDKTTTSQGLYTGAHYAYALSDMFLLGAQFGYSLIALDQQLDTPKTPRDYPSSVFNLDLGLTYILDVLRWVPYATALVGGYGLTGGTVEGLRLWPGVGIAFGVDYRVTPELAVGVGLQEHLIRQIHSDPFSQHNWGIDDSPYPTFTQVFARIEYVIVR